MSGREAVFNVAVCMLLFLGAFIGPFFAILFGDGSNKQMALRIIMVVVAVALVAESVRYVVEGEFCVAALFDVYALFLVLVAFFVL
jgi:hypothetical protein